MREVEFDPVLPATGEELRRNVEHALTLGLPDLRDLPRSTDRLTIFANGPSARLAPGRRGPTLALNGALRLWDDEGPTWWAACDPQALVADFLTDAPAETAYMVASKCHPSVFEALAGRDVTLWHLDEHAYWDLVSERDPIMVAPSITICAFELAHRLGFAGMDTWGWDGCFFGRAHHAVDQPHGGPEIVTNQIDGTLFPTTASWMWEGQNAIRRFELTPRDVRVHGGGMFAALLRHHNCIPEARAA